MAKSILLGYIRCTKQTTMQILLECYMKYRRCDTVLAELTDGISTIADMKPAEELWAV
jgi:hypothetical protein